MNKNNQNQESKLVYELGYLLDAKLSEDKAAQKAEKLGELVAQDSGEVVSSGEPRMRNLAYEITVRREGKRSDHTKAYFGWIKFDNDASVIEKIEKALSNEQDIIRYLIMKSPMVDTVPHVTDNLTDQEAEDMDDSFTEDESDMDDDSDQGDSESDEN